MTQRELNPTRGRIDRSTCSCCFEIAAQCNMAVSGFGRLRDYSALRASPLRGRPGGRSTSLRDVVEPGLFYVGGSNREQSAARIARRY